MATAREMTADLKDEFGPNDALEQFPWLLERELDCIISPDADGLLCGLFMNHYLGWKIRGFYDGKVLVCHKDVQARNCIFLDMEIMRKDVRSVGQHMLLYSSTKKDNVPDGWEDLCSQCFSINNFRKYDASQKFKLKYPFGTLHFLLATLHNKLNVTLKESAIAPLLFIDGTYHNLFRYTENSLDWLRYLGLNNNNKWANPLAVLLTEKSYTIPALMEMMDTFWAARDKFSAKNERGDRVAITRRGGGGEPHNLLLTKQDFYEFNPDAKQRAESFLSMLAEYCGWPYDKPNWYWTEWKLAVFDKGAIDKITIPKFKDLIQNKPLSLAITAQKRVEYTLDPNKLFDKI